MQIIPAINANSFEEVKEKIKLLKPYTDWVQLDVADGTFTKNIIWHNPKDLLDLETKLNIEVHLMINEIEKRVEDWLIPQIKRIIFHIETAQDPDFVIKKIQDAGKEPGMAVGPDGSWTHLAHFKNKVNFFQILGVRPGLPGQELQEETYEQIRQLRKFCLASPAGGRSCIIEVDGGVNKENAKKLVEAGADILCAASAIFKGDIKENIEYFKNVA
ncbi:hypothetical protein KKB71_00320 [Patescibacteria group bacterium]|nr:hypothetical protein [Patescibacteria group bacterium]MBU2218961.1 hypothetical protein [Patescibacteria group bacterium]MBU2263340.1 hypothetical protein [Patescibacteria group bacterium]